MEKITDYKYALDESSIVAITDQKGVIKYVNDNFCNISKYSAEELIGQDHRIINSGYHSKEFIKELSEDFGYKNVITGDTIIRQPYTQKEMATLIGTSRPTLNILLNELKEENYLDFNRKEIILKKIA